MDLTKFYENGLVLDKELHFGSGKDITDAINQMNSDGLAVSFLDTSRSYQMYGRKCDYRPDKSNENLGGMSITRITIINYLWQLARGAKEMVKHRYK